MSLRMRKLIGAIALVLLIALWAAGCAVLAISRMAEADRMTQMIFFSVAGLIWVVPAGAIIRWMQRP